MPTTRVRHAVTETDEISEALDDAALAWPELRRDRGALLLKLIKAGHASLRVGGGVYALVNGVAGAATGSFPRDSRAELLAEWPE